MNPFKKNYDRQFDSQPGEHFLSYKRSLNDYTVSKMKGKTKTEARHLVKLALDSNWPSLISEILNDPESYTQGYINEVKHILIESSIDVVDIHFKGSYATLESCNCPNRFRKLWERSSCIWNNTFSVEQIAKLVKLKEKKKLKWELSGTGNAGTIS